MTTEERQNIEEHLSELDNHALLHLVALERPNYTEEALELAAAELHRRHLDVLNAEQYWEQFPQERIGPDGFCVTCRAQTTDESPGGTFTFNYVGTRLIGFRDICPYCGSVVQRKWFCFVLPLVPLAKYRVLYLEEGGSYRRYVGRKLRDPPDSTPQK